MSKPEKMVQIKAVKWITPKESVTTVGWVDINEKPFKVGDTVTFKDDDKPGNWLVEAIFEGASVRKDQLHTDWNVGGLTKTH